MKEFISSDPTLWRGTPLNHPDWQEGINLSLAFFDEITSLFKTKKLEISLADLSKLYVGIKNVLTSKLVSTPTEQNQKKTSSQKYNDIPPEHIENAIKALSEIRDTLESLLVNPMPSENAKYGYNYSDLEKIFSEIKRTYSQETFELLVKSESEYSRKCSNALPKNPTPVDVEKILPKEWFFGFIKNIFLDEKENISFTLKHNLLTAYIVPRGLDRLNNFPAIIGLDASAYLLRDELETILTLAGFKEEEIVYIRVKPTVKDNVEIVQYLGAKLETRNRTESAKEKVKNLKEQLWGFHGTNITFIDHKPYCEEGDKDIGKNEDLIMLSGDPKRGSRGSNTVYNNNVDNLAQIGTPRPNLGDLRAQYECLGLEKRLTFEEYLNRIILNEVMQNCGRLRANRRLDKKLNFFIVSDFDISTLAEFGYTNIQVKDFNTSFPSLGSAIHKTAYQVMKYLADAGNRTKDLTIDKVAKIMEVGKSAISNLFKPYGGFKTLAEKFTSAIESLLANVNFLDDTLKDALITEELDRILGSPSDYSTSLNKTLSSTQSETLGADEAIKAIATLNIAFSLHGDEIASLYDNWFDEYAKTLVEHQRTKPSLKNEAPQPTYQEVEVTVVESVEKTKENEDPEDVEVKLMDEEKTKEETSPKEKSNTVEDPMLSDEIIVDFPVEETLPSLKNETVEDPMLSEPVEVHKPKSEPVKETLPSLKNGIVKDPMLSDEIIVDFPGEKTTSFEDPELVEVESMKHKEKPVKETFPEKKKTPIFVVMEPDSELQIPRSSQELIELPVIFNAEAFGLKLIKNITELVEGAVVWFAEGFRKGTGKSYLKKTWVEKLREDYLILENGEIVLDTQVSRLLYLGTE